MTSEIPNTLIKRILNQFFDSSSQRDKTWHTWHKHWKIATSLSSLHIDFISQRVKYNSVVLSTTFFFLILFLAFFSVHLGFSSLALFAGLLLELPALHVFCVQPLAACFCILPECCELGLVFHLRMPSQNQTATHESAFYHKQLHPVVIFHFLTV